MKKVQKSKLLSDFIEEIQTKNRNPDEEHTRVLEMLADKDTNPERIFPPGTELYRCRLVHRGDKVGKEAAKGFFGFDASGSFIAPWDKTSDMRANYKYIPYLYCANHPYLAVVEVRPRLGAKVSVATIVVEQELKLLDFTMVGKSRKAMSETKKNLFAALSEMYSTPVTEDDDTLEYIPTQYIAEYAKKRGYDGIIFKSSLTPEWNETEADRYNVVIFSYDKCRASRSNLVEIKEVCYKIERADSDVLTKLEIHTKREQKFYVEKSQMLQQCAHEENLNAARVTPEIAAGV